MKKGLKFGFTLAETLVALGIVGVIAAIVLPNILYGVQNRKHAVALGRSVEAIESGCQALLQYAGEKSTDGLFFGHYNIHKDMNGTDIGSAASNSVSYNSKLLENASEYFKVTPLTSDQKSAYTTNGVKSYSGGTASPALADIASNFAKSPKLGAYYGVKYNVETGSFDDPIIEYIYVDVNGANSPNRYGIDVFLFGLTDRCQMIPAGSFRMKTMTNIPLASEGCSDSGVTNGLSCTQRVIKDGYKINYMRQ